MRRSGTRQTGYLDDVRLLLNAGFGRPIENTIL
jgi:hypothetical protein